MKTKRFISAVMAVVMACACVTSCGDSTSDNTETQSADTSSAEEKLPETDEEWHQAMIDKSLTSYGNVSKLQEKLTAAQAGEEINISYLGGSITEGVGATADTCWAKLSYDYIAEKFGTGDNVTYNNAGLSGTPSKLGIMRLERDVLDQGADICFVEFAVNDGSESEYQTAYESIIRTLIENDVAVVLVFARTEEGHTCQEYMQAQGEYYDLPMISYSDALVYMFDNGKMTWTDFSDDQSHPNEYGHTLVAEMVENLFDGVMDQTAEEYVYPEEPMTEVRQYGVQLFENDALTPTDMGSWQASASVSGFSNGWSHARDAENEPIKFTFTGRFVYMLYQEETQGLGKAHIVIYKDGDLYDELDFDPNNSSGCTSCQVKCIAMSTKDVEYEIEISMAEGYEDKYFAVLGFGYTADEA